MDGQKDQRFFPLAREKAGNQHICINDRPDHDGPAGGRITLAPVGGDVVIAIGRRQACRARAAWAPVQAFSSQSGGGSCVRAGSNTTASAIAPKSQRCRPGRLFVSLSIAVRPVTVVYVA